MHVWESRLKRWWRAVKRQSDSCTSSGLNTSLCPLSLSWLCHGSPIVATIRTPGYSRLVSNELSLCSLQLSFHSAGCNKRKVNCDSVKSHPAFYLWLKVKMSHGFFFSSRFLSKNCEGLTVCCRHLRHKERTKMFQLSIEQSCYCFLLWILTNCLVLLDFNCIKNLLLSPYM